MSDNAYINALRLSLSRYQAELLEIRAILTERPLSNLEYRAAERTLQVAIEACIGIAKHWRAIARKTPIRPSRSWCSAANWRPIA